MVNEHTGSHATLVLVDAKGTDYALVEIVGANDSQAHRKWKKDQNGKAKTHCCVWTGCSGYHLDSAKHWTGADEVPVRDCDNAPGCSPGNHDPGGGRRRDPSIVDLGWKLEQKDK